MTSVDTYKYMRLEEPTKTQKNIVLTTSAFTWTVLHGMLMFSPSSQHHLCTLSNSFSNVKFISCFGSRSYSTASHVSWQKVISTVLCAAFGVLGALSTHLHYGGTQSGCTAAMGPTEAALCPCYCRQQWQTCCGSWRYYLQLWINLFEIHWFLPTDKCINGSQWL